MERNAEGRDGSFDVSYGLSFPSMAAEWSFFAFSTDEGRKVEVVFAVSVKSFVCMYACVWVWNLLGCSVDIEGTLFCFLGRARRW